jgi:hypothetical protein
MTYLVRMAFKSTEGKTMINAAARPGKRLSPSGGVALQMAFARGERGNGILS